MYTQKKPIENTHIVRERDRRRNRELLAVLSLGVPIGLFLLLFTWQNLEVIRLGREATRLQKQLKDTDATHKSLAAELDRLTALDTVEKKATALGFAPTDPKTIVMVGRRAEGRGPRAASPSAPATSALAATSSLSPQPSALSPSPAGREAPGGR